VVKQVTLLCLSLIWLCGAAPLQAAGLVYTYVSASGNDAEDCSRITPCRTLNAALGKTEYQGVVTILDPGLHGTSPATISSVTIVGSGTDFAIAPGSSIIAGGAVHLIGFSIDGGTSGASTGLKIFGGSRVHLENCKIRNFRGPSGVALAIEQGAYPHSQVTVANCTFSNNSVAVRVMAESNGMAAVYLDNVKVVGNIVAIHAKGVNALVLLSNALVALNNIALLPQNLGRIFSFGNTSIGANTSNGPSPLPLTQQ
jgi:hypothetical protein